MDRNYSAICNWAAGWFFSGPFKPSMGTIQMLPASGCPEKNQPAFITSINLLLLNSYDLSSLQPQLFYWKKQP
jgi:hypothetical protein